VSWPSPPPGGRRFQFWKTPAAAGRGTGGHTLSARQTHTAPTYRRRGTAEVRQYGSTEVRNYGSTELRKYGTTELRNYGSTELRKYGTTELRKVKKRRCTRKLPGWTRINQNNRRWRILGEKPLGTPRIAPRAGVISERAPCREPIRYSIAKRSDPRPSRKFPRPSAFLLAVWFPDLPVVSALIAYPKQSQRARP
jgi:hypothetical protein